MKHSITAAALFLAISAGPASAGCATGALVGAGVGHLAHHHAVLGGIAGCAIGHHHAKVEARRRREEMQRQAERSGNTGAQYSR